ncbi:hypothetical protein SLA2020_214010 [Shorea laevis]
MKIICGSQPKLHIWGSPQNTRGMHRIVANITVIKPMIWVPWFLTYLTKTLIHNMIIMISECKRMFIILIPGYTRQHNTSIAQGKITVLASKTTNSIFTATAVLFILAVIKKRVLVSLSSEVVRNFKASDAHDFITYGVAKPTAEKATLITEKMVIIMER